MPTWVIFTLHVRQGQVLQYRMDRSPMRSRPASSRAFSSAWRQRHVESPIPALDALLHRGPMSLLAYGTLGSPVVHLEEPTSTLVAVGHSPRCTVVPSTYHSLLSYHNAPYPSFHEVASMRGQVCKLHEVLIPARSEPCLIW